LKRQTIYHYNSFATLNFFFFFFFASSLSFHSAKRNEKVDGRAFRLCARL